MLYDSASVNTISVAILLKPRAPLICFVPWPAFTNFKFEILNAFKVLVKVRVIHITPLVNMHAHTDTRAETF